jgi:hypothetical protein
MMVRALLAHDGNDIRIQRLPMVKFMYNELRCTNKPSSSWSDEETSCRYFVSKTLPDVNRQIETITSRDQVFSSVKGKYSKTNSRLEKIMESKLSAWIFFSSVANKDNAKNHYSTEAIIYRSRLVVCIMDEFRHGGDNGQTSRFILKSESDSREMTFSEAADKIRRAMKNKSNRK